MKKAPTTVWLTAPNAGPHEIDCAPDGSLWADGKCIKAAPNGSMWWPENKRIGFDKKGNAIPHEPDDYDPALACAPRQKRGKRISTITGKLTALREETEIQIAIVTYYDKRTRLDKRLRENTRLYAVNPVPGKTKRQAELSKAMGLRKGIYDLCLIRKSPWRLVWIEIKATGGYLTSDQKDWRAWLKDTPIWALECTSVESFIRILEAE